MKSDKNQPEYTQKQLMTYGTICREVNRRICGYRGITHERIGDWVNNGYQVVAFALGVSVTRLDRPGDIPRIPIGWRYLLIEYGVWRGLKLLRHREQEQIVQKRWRDGLRSLMEETNTDEIALP